MKCAVIDRLREQIQHRLDQIMSEAGRLRRALAALDPLSSSPPARNDREQAGRARAQARSGAPGSKASPTRGASAGPVTPALGGSATRGRPARRSADPEVASSVRTAPGTTRAAALAGGEPMTAGELARRAACRAPPSRARCRGWPAAARCRRPSEATGSRPPNALTEPANGAITATLAVAPTEPEHYRH